MATTQDLRTNIIIRYNGVLHRVVEFHHHAPGNWRAMVILKLKNLQTGKVIEDRVRGVLVGATSAGPTGGEVLSMLTLAVHERITVERLRSMIFAYPTFHRAVEAALDDLLSH